MTGGKTPDGIDGVLPNDAAAAIDEKQRTEQHWRRAGSLVPDEDNPPLGARKVPTADEKPASPTE